MRTLVFFATPAAIAILSAACAKGSDATLDDPDAGDAGSPVPGSPDGGVRPDGASTADDAGGDAERDGTSGDACATALAAASFSFEASDEGFTHGISDGVLQSDVPGWPFDGWTRGSATAGTACHSGSCFGVELTQNYAQCERGYLLSPAIDLSACAGRDVSLVFQHAYAFWTGSYGGTTWFDGGIVEVSKDGASWTPVAPATGTGTLKINPDRTTSYRCVNPPGFGVDNEIGFVGKQATTTKVTIPLPAGALGTSTRVRFSFASGVSSATTNADASRSATDFGWRIDDVGFEAR